ncbi:MAG: class I adenylate-forming enzyme family protein [Thiobacillaceae bacterium]
MEENRQKFDDAISRLTQPGAPYELVTQRIDGIDYRLFKNAPKTLADLFEPARSFGEKEFLVYQQERWSFNDLFEQADAIGHQLIHRFNVKKGDRVAIAMRNLPEWMTAFIAITSIGAVAVPINSWGTTQELEYALADAGATIVFCDQQRLDYLATSLKTLNIQAVVARPEIRSLPEHSISMEEFIREAKGACMPDADVDPEDLALILYTSGTTGKPKGAVSRHRNVCQAIIDMEATGAAIAMANPEATDVMVKKGLAPKSLLAVPLFHVSGLHAQFLLNLRGGRTLVMMYKWDVEKACDYIVQEKITSINAAPSMLLQLFESEKFARIDTHSLFGFGCGGSASPPKLLQLIFKKIPTAFPGAGWGTTETNAIASSFSGEAFKLKPHSAGFLHPIVELRFVDEEGNEVAAGERGEIWIKSPTNVTGYWNAPAVNVKEFKDGWFRTGDIGYIDSDGHLIICDRAKDMVIRGGENIYCVEIESLIASYPGVLEVAAFGIPDEAMGEALVVIITKADDSDMNEDAIKQYVGEHLAKFKIPSLVQITGQSFPRTPTGKVLKRDMRKRFLDQLHDQTGELLKNP